MEKIEISLPSGAPPDTLSALIESVAANQELSIRLRGTLRSYPGSIHWHLERPGERGTLEITLWPAKLRLWLSVQAGRRAAWIETCLPQVKVALEQAIADRREIGANHVP